MHGMKLTDKQRAKVSHMRARGYTDKKIAEIMDVALASVTGVARGAGRPRSNLTPEQKYARKLLKAALSEKSEADRLVAVKSVIGNFGRDLDCTLADAQRVCRSGIE